jgi:hypothetical protein
VRGKSAHSGVYTLRGTNFKSLADIDARGARRVVGMHDDQSGHEPFEKRANLSGLHDQVCRMLLWHIPLAVRLCFARVNANRSTQTGQRKPVNANRSTPTGQRKPVNANRSTQIKGLHDERDVFRQAESICSGCRATGFRAQADRRGDRRFVRAFGMRRRRGRRQRFGFHRARESGDWPDSAGSRESSAAGAARSGVVGHRPRCARDDGEPLVRSAGQVARYPFDPSSIHQLLEWRFGLDPLGVRGSDPDTFNLAYALDLTSAPRTDAPVITVTQGTFGTACALAPSGGSGLGSIDNAQQTGAPVSGTAASGTPASGTAASGELAKSVPGGRFADLRAKATALGFPQ